MTKIYATSVRLEKDLLERIKMDADKVGLTWVAHG